MKIAVIGTGISGIAAAWGLKDKHDVILYEAENRPGGHSATVDIDHEGKKIPVDTGFIVCNDLNYPNLTAFFRELGVGTKKSSMSFSVSTHDRRVEWSGDSLRAVFASRRNLISPSFVWMLREIFRFNDAARRDHALGNLGGLSLGEYLRKNRYSRRFSTEYLLPMGAAIWSTPRMEIMAFPAETFIGFFVNHRLVNWRRPEWRTVEGGSRTYVERALSAFSGKIRLDARVTRIVRANGQAAVTDISGNTDVFDHVVIASHSDQALAILESPDDYERHILGGLRYRPNTVYLHSDADLMPKRRLVWSSWNYMCNGEGDASRVTVSYWMNRLQSIDDDCPLFITLNPSKPPRNEFTYRQFVYDHPQFDGAALSAQRELHTLQGRMNTWFCGAYHGSGFHEDGFRSGISVAESLGGDYSWRPDRTSRRADAVGTAA